MGVGDNAGREREDRWAQTATSTGHNNRNRGGQTDRGEVGTEVVAQGGGVAPPPNNTCARGGRKMAGTWETGNRQTRGRADDA